MIKEHISKEAVDLCPACGSAGKIVYYALSDKLYNTPGTWNLFSCDLCDTLWLNPRPVKEDIHKLYSNYFTHEEPPQVPIHSNEKIPLKETLLDFILLGRRRERELFFNNRLINSNCSRHIFDVGCGNGSFLANMKNFGWEVCGCEPDPKSAMIAIHKGLEVHIGTIDSVSYPDNSFDVITLSHVLEHTPDPIQTLLDCHRLLKPGGILSIITPNNKSIGHRIFKQFWHSLDPPRHLVLFSPKSLTKIIESIGFNITFTTTSTWYSNNILGGSQKYLFNSKAGRNRRIKNYLFPNKFFRFFILLFEHYGNKLFKTFGEEIGLVARKKEPIDAA